LETSVSEQVYYFNKGGKETAPAGHGIKALPFPIGSLEPKASPGYQPLHSAECGNETANEPPVRAIPRKQLNNYNISNTF
jgi:hypothetical protein